MYRTDRLYKTLSEMIEDAGVKILYQKVPDDSIDGEILARADYKSIMMPDEDVFPDAWTATWVLGHEMAHILTGADSPDDPKKREKNETLCDEVGKALREFAALKVEKEIEKEIASASE